MTRRARRRAVLVFTVLVAGATTAWAHFTATPMTVNVICQNGGSGGSSFQIANSFNGSNNLTITSVGSCPGYYITPNPFMFNGAGSQMFVVSVVDPGVEQCTFEMDGTANPQPFPLPTFTVTTTNCGAMPGELTVSPPAITFPPIQVNNVTTQPFFVTNNTGGVVTSVEYSVGPPFSLDCGSTSCIRDYSMFPLANGLGVMPNPTVSCSSPTPGPYTGTVSVTANGGLFLETIDLSCTVTPAGMGPQISVPDTVTVPPVNAGAGPSTMQFQINNTSITPGATLNVTGITKSGVFQGEWSVLGCQPSCGIPAGMSATIEVRLMPEGVGDRPIQLLITSNDVDPLSDSTKTVNLHGVGLGALVASSPVSNTTLDFGQVPVGEISGAQVVELVNTGNVDLTVQPYTSSPEYLVSPDTPTPVPWNGPPAQFLVRCAPQSVGPLPAGTFTIEAPGNYMGPTQFDFPLDCEGFNATLEVTPPSIAFGSHRIKAPDESTSLSIRNQTGGPVTVGPLTVDNPAFTLSGFAVGGPAVLADGVQEDVMVTFSPTVEGMQMGDIAGIEPGRLVRVTGTGTEPNYQAVPSEHDFGRLCVGDPVMQQFALSISPSSDILVQSVELGGDPGYMMSYVEPMGYPVSLAPTQEARVDVTVVARAGQMDGTLTWTTDVADPVMRVVPLQLEGIADGLSVTPVAVDFGPIAAGMSSAEMRPTLKSCGADTFDVTAELRGNDDAVFLLSGPEQATITESPTMPWGVIFAPDRPGRFTATLRLTPSSGDPVDIELVGGGQIDGGPGGVTNYYACGCTGGGGGIIPGLVVLVVITARRRRGSS